MKSLVNQKLSDFNIKGALQILSGDSSFDNPSKESLDTLQQKHPQVPPDLMLPPSPSATTPPTYFSQTQIYAAISSFPMTPGQAQSVSTAAFETLHINLCRWSQHFSPHQPKQIS